MSHGPIICRGCFAEVNISTAAAGSEADERSRAELVCPNCGGGSFGI